MKKHHNTCQCYECLEKVKEREYEHIRKEAERIAKDDEAFERLEGLVFNNTKEYQSWMDVAASRIYTGALIVRAGGFDKVFKKWSKMSLVEILTSKQ